jgi:3',5'-cyclic AMP phosphodiesterase CpdA
MLIAQLTDLHCRPRGEAANRMVESNMLTERALRAVMRLDPLPDLVLITGDLAHRGEPAAYALLADMLARNVRIPVCVIPGNHDDRAAMIAHLPGTRHEGGFVQYVVEDGPVRVVMLDTLVPGSAAGELCEARLAWLDATLARVPDRPTLIGMHHPPFATGLAYMDAVGLREPRRFAEVVARHRQVERIVCGHVHRAVTARLGHAVVSIAPSVADQVALDLRPDAPSELVLEPAAFALHAWTASSGIVSHIAYVEDFPGPFPYLP